MKGPIFWTEVISGLLGSRQQSDSKTADIVLL